jgi:pyruvate dehydrogenase (quinone)
LIGSSAGYEAVKHCDVLVMIGTDYPYSEYLPERAKVVQIDDRAFVIGRRVAVDQAVVGSARPAVAGLLERVAPRDAERFLSDVQKTWGTWRKMLDEHADLGRSHDKIHPQSLVRTVNDLAARNAVYVVDTGEVTLWTANWLKPTGEQRVVA